GEARLAWDDGRFGLLLKSGGSPPHSTLIVLRSIARLIARFSFGAICWGLVQSCLARQASPI
ncbi:MAG: hypothetical protein WA197_26760, partial [Candidatus Acidiferrales bacterium]